ncbi:septum formation initiator family protein [Paracrocinitomix mangrovi]|uniref:FtsB family cell division protein n=1 Tax=Paracrocinitomix mangrovi TaxID=2862509 RepID=UPI001C8DF41A|nr:septum formation initiator family protein [Paracrocinitomix mangrovi]UKN02407.1 septum formation initiator family protein [Paracrocinitomix mangrovi]
MKKVIPMLKNKYLISTSILVLYVLILHETDIFAIKNKRDRIADLKEQIEIKRDQIEDLKVSLNELEDPRALEKYAREEHLFKKDDEDIFVFSFE